MRKYFWGALLVVVGIIANVSSIFGPKKWLQIIFGVVALVGLIIIVISFIKDRKRAAEKIEHSKHPGLLSGLELIKDNKNKDVVISKFIKNIKYSDNNRTSNVTEVINGTVIPITIIKCVLADIPIHTIVT